MNILVVDDSRVWSDAWADILSRKLGVAVHCVATEYDAMRAIDDAPFDAVVSGYYFSGDSPDDGFARIMSAIRRKANPTPVIFVAGHVRPQDSFAAAKLGAFDFVVLDKQADPTGLVNAVRSALELRRIPRLFISYSSRDRTFASTLAAKLIEHGWQVWYDQWEINVGDSLISKIEQGILGSSYFVVVLSETSVASRWVREELEAAMLRTLNGENVLILPVRIDACPVPAFLRSKKYADFRDGFEHGLDQIIKAVAVH